MTNILNTDIKKIILSLLCGKICISSSLSPVVSPVPVIYIIMGENTCSHAEINARCGLDSEYLRWHTAQIIPNESHEGLVQLPSPLSS